MKTYYIKQNKKRAWYTVGALFAAGVLILLTSFLEIPFGMFLQLIGVVLLVIAMFVFNAYLAGGICVKIDDNPDAITKYPKLHVYTTKGNHNVSTQYFFMPFNKIKSITDATGISKSKLYRSTTLKANIKPEKVYMILYTEGNEDMALYCDLDREVYDEIQKRVSLFSGLEEEDDVI